MIKGEAYRLGRRDLSPHGGGWVCHHHGGKGIKGGEGLVESCVNGSSQLIAC